MLNNEEQNTLLRLAKESIGLFFEKQSCPVFKQSIPSPLNESLGVFVTLKIHGELRGCIGRIFTSEPLWQSVVQLARESAFHDSRFSPLTPGEFTETSIEISVLSKPKEISSFEEITLGIHGIIVSHSYNKALFLPQVAIEQNWDKETYLSHCCRKAGLDPFFWKTGKLKIEVFTAFVFSE